MFHLAEMVFAYNAGFECRVMRELAGRFPELAVSLEAIIARGVDLLPIVAAIRWAT